MKLSTHPNKKENKKVTDFGKPLLTKFEYQQSNFNKTTLIWTWK